MIDSPTTYEHLEANFIEWATGQSNIRSAIVIGSRARSEPPPDDWSDLDIILFASQPDVYASDPAWLSNLGEIWLTHHNRTFAGDAEWMALFRGGFKVDVVLANTSGSLQKAIEQSPYRDVLRRGLRLLFDKECAASKITLPDRWFSPPVQPTEAEFSALIDHALLTASRTARLLKRGELWQAKDACDTTLKDQLLTMLEWHARARQNTPIDTWYDGRYIEQWADRQALSTLPDTFAAYNAVDLWRALFATLALFRRLAHEVSQQLGYTYPAQRDQTIISWIKTKREPEP